MNNIKALYIKNLPAIITVFSLFILLLGVANLYSAIMIMPISNDECLWVTKKDGTPDQYLEITQIKPNGVTWNAGIKDGDILMEINGKPVKNAAIAMSLINHMKTGEYARYTIKRDAHIFKTNVYIKKLLDFGTLGFNLLAFIWFIVGFIVLKAKSDGEIQRAFYKIGTLFIIFFSYNYIAIDFPGNFIFSNKIVFYLWTFAAVLTILYLAFNYVYFFFVFPKPFKFIRKPRIKKFFFRAPLAGFICFTLYTIVFSILPADQMKAIAAVNISAKALISSLVIGLISLLISYRRLKTPEEKRPVFVILVAYILGMLSIFYTSFIATILTDNFFNSPEYYTPVILIVLIPISFGYSIFKYQLMDVSIVVKNTIVYGTATAAIAVIYLLTMYGLGQSIGSAFSTEYRSAIAAFTFVLFALVFQSTKDRFQDLLTKKFYPEQFTYQQVILKFSNDVVTIVGRDNILQSMRDTFVSSLKIKKFGILLCENEPCNFKLYMEHGINNKELTLQNRERILKEFISEKLIAQNPVVIERGQFEDVFPYDYQLLVDEGIYTVVPMVINGRIIGLLLFGLKYSGSQFAGKDIDLLCAAAGQAAVAIENARLYEAEAEKITIERDLTLAKRIQQGLLPKCIPDMKGLGICGLMQPAMQVGGDYYDFIKISPTKFFIVVGDVSGKGLSASLYMTKLQTMMLLYCTENKSPREILVDVNKRIYEAMERNWFITASLALIDTADSSIRFCRAGHLPLVAVVDGKIKYYEPKGLGLGLDDGKIFNNSLEEIKIDYRSGDLFAFFSDGITEAMNDKDELFGDERLQKVLETYSSKSAYEISDEIISSIVKHRGSREQNDDITLVTLKVN